MAYTNPFAKKPTPAKLEAGSYKKATVTNIYDDGNIRLEKDGKTCVIPTRAKADRTLKYVVAEGHKATSVQEVEDIISKITHSTIADITLQDEVSETNGQTYSNVIRAKFAV
jgi:hypothetical protein